MEFALKEIQSSCTRLKRVSNKEILQSSSKKTNNIDNQFERHQSTASTLRPGGIELRNKINKAKRLSLTLTRVPLTPSPRTAETVQVKSNDKTNNNNASIKQSTIHVFDDFPSPPLVKPATSTTSTYLQHNDNGSSTSTIDDPLKKSTQYDGITTSESLNTNNDHVVPTSSCGTIPALNNTGVVTSSTTKKTSEGCTGEGITLVSDQDVEKSVTATYIIDDDDLHVHELEGMANEDNVDNDFEYNDRGNDSELSYLSIASGSGSIHVQSSNEDYDEGTPQRTFHRLSELDSQLFLPQLCSTPITNPYTTTTDKVSSDLPPCGPVNGPRVNSNRTITKQPTTGQTRLQPQDSVKPINAATPMVIEGQRKKEHKTHEELIADTNKGKRTYRVNKSKRNHRNNGITDKLRKWNKSSLMKMLDRKRSRKPLNGKRRDLATISSSVIEVEYPVCPLATYEEDFWDQLPHEDYGTGKVIRDEYNDEYPLDPLIYL